MLSLQRNLEQLFSRLGVAERLTAMDDTQASAVFVNDLERLAVSRGKFAITVRTDKPELVFRFMLQQYNPAWNPESVETGDVRCPVWSKLNDRSVFEPSHYAVFRQRAEELADRLSKRGWLENARLETSIPLTRDLGVPDTSTSEKPLDDVLKDILLKHGLGKEINRFDGSFLLRLKQDGAELNVRKIKNVIGAGYILGDGTKSRFYGYTIMPTFAWRPDGFWADGKEVKAMLTEDGSPAWSALGNALFYESSLEFVRSLEGQNWPKADVLERTVQATTNPVVPVSEPEKRLPRFQETDEPFKAFRDKQTEVEGVSVSELPVQLRADENGQLGFAF